ncbi:MAG: gliding motility-associated C-terminal domain-containing protein [Bacteroidales bacterium]|nr:gliding motility-associated C-terminal domain-containing protein [Bacteroidales bacterium]
MLVLQIYKPLQSVILKTNNYMKLLPVKILFFIILLNCRLFGQIIDIPDIRYVTINPLNNEITIAWDSSLTANIAFTRISYVLRDGFGRDMLDLHFNRDTSITFSLDTIPNSIIDTDSIDRPLGFSVSVYDINNNGKLALNSFHKTMYLKGSYLFCPERVELSWTPYTTGELAIKTIQNYTIYGINNNQLIPLKQVEGNINSYVFDAESIEAYKCFCIGVSFLGYDNKPCTSFSNKVCIEKKITDKPRYFAIDNLTVGDNDKLNLEFRYDTTSSFKKLHLYYFENPSQKFELLDSTSFTNLDDTINIVELNNLNSKQKYLFKLYLLNDCNEIIDSSNFGSNIVLTIQEKTAFDAFLEWNKYIGWNGEISRHEIYRSIDNDTFEKINSLSNNYFTYTDYLNLLAEDHNSFCYYIKTIQKPIQNEKEIWSKSNTFCINKTARVFVPNTIIPNSSIAENKIFKVYSTYLSSEGFRLVIFDQWGKLQFESTNPNDYWDATSNGKFVQEGTYIYHLEYSTTQGNIENKKGTVNVLFERN